LHLVRRFEERTAAGAEVGSLSLVLPPITPAFPRFRRGPAIVAEWFGLWVINCSNERNALAFPIHRRHG
jgi:hypothetical protein